MKICGIKCTKCGDLIYSRARHDMRWCSCGEVAINGGRAYFKVVGEVLSWEPFELNLNVSEKELYDDWNEMKDEYGKYEGDEDKIKFIK